MTDLSVSLISAATLMVGIAIVSLASLHGWGQWLALRRHEIDQHGHVGLRPQDDGISPSTGNRIELADLRERVRKLEAIAAGVDL